MDVVQNVDVRFARHLGLALRPISSSHVLPGLGRAQERVNAAIDDCDIFVGIANLRMGTPTGDYQSGFEEEVERIRARFDAGDPVVVLLYLRNLDDENDAEPAMQTFRERLVDMALVRWFDGLEDFRWQLQEDLAQVLAERTRERIQGLQRAATVDAQSLSGPTPEPAGLPPGDDTDGDGQAADAQAANALQALVTGNAEAVTLVRAHLAIAARVSVGLTQSTLDIHDMNRLYEYREEIDPTQDERLMLVRTASVNQLAVPVWGIVKLEDDDPVIWLARTLLEDRDDHVRAGASAELGTKGIHEVVRVLRERGVEAKDVYERLLESSSDAVRRTAIAALGSSGLPEAESMLRQHSVDGDSVLVFEQLAMFLASGDPGAAVDHAAESPSWVTPSFRAALIARARDLPQDRLAALLSGTIEAKVLGLQLASARSDELSGEVLGLLADRSPRVRRAAIATCTARGVKLADNVVEKALEDSDGHTPFFGFSEPELSNETLRRGQLVLQTAASRAASVNWANLRGGDALASAVMAGDVGAAELARRSLGDDLPSIRETCLEARLAASENDTQRGFIQTMADEHRGLLDRLWVDGAIAGLVGAQNYEAGDAELAVRHIDDAMRGDHAAKLLAATATAEHLDPLVAAAGATRDAAVRQRLIERAVEQCGASAVLERVDSVDDPDRLLQVLLALLADSEHSLPREAILPYLYRRDNGVRRSALRALIVGLTHDELSEFLDAQSRTLPRYYEVVGILDRLVYGPAFAQARARETLESP